MSVPRQPSSDHGNGKAAGHVLSRAGRLAPFPGWPALAPAAAGLALLCGLAAVAAPPAGAQAVRGLLIGINEYDELRPLKGAVSDVRDVAQALSGVGAEDIVVLENAAASRERIASEWRALVARSDPGDTIVLTYAGHGGQEPARFPDTEKDRKDEVLLLGGFRATGSGTRERIFDDELNQWFVEAGARDLRVIFVADSCHSGDLTRSQDPRAPLGASRAARYSIVEDMLAFSVDESIAAMEEEDLPHVSFLAASQESQVVHEVPLENEEGNPEPRGVLSYHFARALEGEADQDGDGVLRRDELWRFVRENVKAKSHSRQFPNLEPESDAEILLRVPRAPAPGGGAIAGASGAAGSAGGSAVDFDDVFDHVPPLRLHVLHGDSATLASIEATVEGARLVSRDELPEFIWDARSLEMVSDRGDVVAHEVGPADLQAVIDKWRAVRVIQDLSARSSLAMRLFPGYGAYRDDTIYDVEVHGLRHRSLVLIMLSAKGQVHYLSKHDDASRITPGRPFPLTLRVTEPFGADHIVAVSAASPLGLLDIELERLDGDQAARRVAGLLVAASGQATDWWSGVQGLFSIP